MRIKRASKDFTEHDLPSNRKEVFFDCFKLRFMTLFKCGLLLLLFTTPLLLVVLFKNVYLSNAYNNYLNATITEEEYSGLLYSLSLTFDLLITLSTLIASIGVSGMTRVIRQVGWEEPVFFSKDFFDGIKLNYKYIALSLLFLALIYLASDLSRLVDIEPELIKYIPFCAMMIMFLPVALYNIAQVNIYNVNFTKATKNSLLLYIKSVPVTLIFVAVIYLVSLLKYFPYTFYKCFIFIFIIIFLVPFFYLAWFLVSSRVFDVVINVNYYPEIVDKGIVRKPGYKKPEPTLSIEELRKEIEEENKTENENIEE